MRTHCINRSSGALLVLLSIFIFQAQWSFSQTIDKHTKVEVLQLSPQSLKGYASYVGHLEPRTSITISAELAGIVEQVSIDQGSVVQENQMIAQIDTERLSLNYQLKRSNFELATQDYKREKQLVKKKISTDAKLSTLKNKRDVSKLMLQLAKLDLERSKVVSPISGVIKNKYIESGEYIGKGAKLVEVFDISRVLAVINIPERDIRFVKRGKRVQVSVEAYPSRKFSGKIKNIGLEADKKSRSFEIEALVDNEEQLLLPGMLIRVHMLKFNLNNQIVIPRHTIQESESGSFVYIVKDGRTQRRKVKIGISVFDKIQILNGLRYGDYLVDSGHQLITPNELVSVIKLKKQ